MTEPSKINVNLKLNVCSAFSNKSTRVEPTIIRHPNQGMCQCIGDVIEEGPSEIHFELHTENLVDMPNDFVLESYIILKSTTNIIDMPDDLVLESFILEYDRIKDNKQKTS